MSKITSRRRFTRTVSYSLRQSRYQEGRTSRRIELVLPERGAMHRNPADRRA